MTCRTTSAGAVQLESHKIEAWSMIQQMVLLSSAESEFHAVDAPNVDRRETLGRRRKQDRRTGATPETRAEDVAEQTIQAVEKVPDDGLHICLPGSSEARDSDKEIVGFFCRSRECWHLLSLAVLNPGSSEALEFSCVHVCLYHGSRADQPQHARLGCGLCTWTGEVAFDKFVMLAACFALVDAATFSSLTRCWPRSCFLDWC